MPTKRSFLTVLAGCLAFAACKSDTDVQPDRRFVSYKMDGKVVLAEQRTRAYYTPGNVTDADPANDFASMLLTVYTYDKDIFSLRVVSSEPDLKPGIYTNASHGTLLNIEKFLTFELITADEDYGNLSVTIHELKDSLIVGEFYGSVVSMDDGSIKNIQDGVFKLRYQQTP